MVDDYFIPTYCILPKKCVVKEIFISEWRIGDVHQKKEGGSYQKKSGCIRRIDTYLNEIVLQSGDRIPLDEIVDIDGVIAAADEV